MPQLTPEEIKLVNDAAERLMEAREEALQAMEEGMPVHKRRDYADDLSVWADLERKRRLEDGQ